ncbi:MAG: rRNA maturation RNase YbeY [Flavobacteriaceae bacterium]|tara:strand:+ start:454 stop:867 length:414 start_codon:yes stop_codon:yes gene_type:complete
MSTIKFFYHTGFFLSNEELISTWLLSVINGEEAEALSLDYSFVDKKEMIKINKNHLNHNYLTDVLAFDYSKDNKIQGDVFVSEEMVRTNAEEYNQEFSKELMRVMVHALLHLCGHKDKTPDEQKNIRALEDKYLALL